MFDAVMRSWQRVPLRVQGIITVSLPLLAVTISAALALFGNYQRARIEADVQRKFQMATGLSEVLTLMVNAETGMRGYLLTKREEFLEPFATASRNLPVTMGHVRALAEAEPGEKPRLEKLSRLDQIQKLVDRQMSDLATQQGYVATPKTFNTDIYDHLAFGKNLMDEIRLNLNAMQIEEERLLTERIAEINQIRRRDFTAVFLALVVGLGTRLIAWHLFKIGILRRVKRLVVNVRSLRRGEASSFPPSDKQDALGDLEQEIALASKEFVAPGGIEKTSAVQSLLDTPR